MAPNSEAGTWTKPFHGVQHLGDRPRWVTVTDRGSFGELTRWYPGCGYNPLQSMHPTADAARAAGERWMQGGAA
jgi:hypothetical protein